MPLLWHKARGHWAKRCSDDFACRWVCMTCGKQVYRRADDAVVRTIAVVALVLLLAVAGLWLAVELARTPLRDRVDVVVPAIQPATPTPGPPVTDWRPPQHRWETTPR